MLKYCSVAVTGGEAMVFGLYGFYGFWGIRETRWENSMRGVVFIY